MALPVTNATHFENICSDDHILDDNNLSSYYENNNSVVALSSAAIRNNNSRVCFNASNQTLGSASSHHQLTSCYCCR